MPYTETQFTGCLLGLATGDTLGAPYEGGVLERLVWKILRRTKSGDFRWTDDTQMAIDLAESLLRENGLVQDSLARQFAASYRWSRGYGPGAARILKRIRRGQPWQQAATAVYAQGSYGNGAGMRAPVLALFYAQHRDQLADAARRSAAVTHAHPLGIDGAVVIALATHALLDHRSPQDVIQLILAEPLEPKMAERLTLVKEMLHTTATQSPRDVTRQLGNGITALTSCPTAIYIALRHLNSSFEAMLEFIIQCRGDVDTIAAMAGAMWGSVHGLERIPVIKLEQRDHLLSLATQLYRRLS